MVFLDVLWRRDPWRWKRSDRSSSWCSHRVDEEMIALRVDDNEKFVVKKYHLFLFQATTMNHFSIDDTTKSRLYRTSNDFLNRCIEKSSKTRWYLLLGNFTLFDILQFPKSDPKIDEMHLKLHSMKPIKSFSRWCLITKFRSICHIYPMFLNRLLSLQPSQQLQEKSFHDQEDADNVFQKSIEFWSISFYVVKINEFLIVSKVLIITTPYLTAKDILKLSDNDLKLTFPKSNYFDTNFIDVDVAIVQAGQTAFFAPSIQKFLNFLRKKPKRFRGNISQIERAVRVAVWFPSFRRTFQMNFYKI